MATNPSTFTATASLGKVSLLWTSSGATEYRIYRATGTGGYVLVYTADSSTFSHVDYVPNYTVSGALHDYDYKLAAWDSGGEASGVFDSVTMPALTSADVNSTGVLDTELITGNVSNTYSNSTTTATINAHTTTIYDGRAGSSGIYDTPR